MSETAADELRRALIASDPKLSRFSPLPRILAYDDFSQGTNGWVELIGNHDGQGDLDTVDGHMVDMRPPQLSSCTFFDVGTHGAMSGTYALKVATRPIAGHTGVAIRRFTMSGRGLVQFETYFTYKAEAASEENGVADHPGAADWDGNTHPSEAQFGAFSFGTDICDGPRYHCVVRYLNTELDGGFARQWKYPTIPEPTPKEHLEAGLKTDRTTDYLAPDPADWEPFGQPQELCYNEVPTKINWHYLRWLIDTRERRNVELQVNDRVYDIRHVPVPPYKERYAALEDLLNFHVSVRTHTNIRNFLYLDSVLISTDW